MEQDRAGREAAMVVEKSEPDATDNRHVLGLMSGTSGDGIDAACVAIRGRGLAMEVRYLWHRHYPFRPALRRRVHALMAPAEARTEDLARVHAELGDAFADAAGRSIEASIPSQRPHLIGLAGQTVCHLPGNPP